MSYEYFVSKDYKIDSKIYKNFVDGGYNEVFKIQNGLILKQIYYGPYYTQTKEVKEILEGKTKVLDRIPKNNWKRQKI